MKLPNVKPATFMPGITRPAPLSLWATHNYPHVYPSCWVPTRAHKAEFYDRMNCDQQAVGTFSRTICNKMDLNWL